jgi:2-keto-4-pentenoate hydratase
MQQEVTVPGEEIAAKFLAARRTGATLAAYPGPLPSTLAEAYAIQDAAIALRGEAVDGWKIGRIHSPLAETLGTTRLIGPVAASQCRMLDEDGTGYRIANGFGAIEAELMLRVGEAVAPGDRHWTAEEALALVDAAHIGFEIASSPFPAINTNGPLVTISDWGNNHGLLIGPAIAEWHQRDLDAIACVMQIDGQQAGAGTAAAFPSGIAGSLLALLDNLAWRGIALAAGTWISTGAITGVHEVIAGQIAVAEFAGIGTIRAVIANQPIG